MTTVDPREAQAIAACSNAFAMDLWGRARAQAGNLAVSPFSILTALAMTWAGARGETDAQMRKVFHVGNADRDRVIAALGAVLAGLQDPEEPLTLKIADGLFVERSYALEPGYLRRVAAAFGLESSSSDAGAPAAPVSALSPGLTRLLQTINERWPDRLVGLWDSDWDVGHPPNPPHELWITLDKRTKGSGWGGSEDTRARRLGPELRALRDAVVKDRRVAKTTFIEKIEGGEFGGAGLPGVQKYLRIFEAPSEDSSAAWELPLRALPHGAHADDPGTWGSVPDTSPEPGEAGAPGEGEQLDGGPVERVDFRTAPEAARRTINAWVAKATQDRIRDLIPAGGVDKATRLVLANAIYFLGDWAAPFEKHMTRPEPFTTSGGTSSVPTMHTSKFFRYADVGGAKLLDLPYKGGRFAMTLILPDAGVGLEALEAGLVGKDMLGGWLPQLARTRVKVSLPKFTIDPPSSLALADVLKALGMTAAFDQDRADFKGIANPPDPRDQLHVGNVFHKAFVKVDEKGTEAAAATAVVMARATSVHAPEKAEEFKADRPFLFLLRDLQTGLVLFMGRVADPGGGGGARAGDTSGIVEDVTDNVRLFLKNIRELVAPSARHATPVARAPATPTPGFKDIDLGDHHLRFVNSFPDSEFLGIHFPGLCGGMSYTTLDYFYTQTPAPETTVTPPMTDVIGKYVHERQFDSLFGFHLARFGAMMVNPDDAAVARQTAASFEELRGAIDAGTPVPLGLIPAPWSLDVTKVTKAHQVVATGYSVGADGVRKVFIWDPNRPTALGTSLTQDPATGHWIEAATKENARHDWRGWFVESGYTAKQPPVVAPLSLAPRSARAPSSDETSGGLLLRKIEGQPAPGRLAGKLEVSRDGGRSWNEAQALGLRRSS